jgi:hypothetical protein
MQSKGHPIRLRAVVIGLIFSAVICGLTPINNIYDQGTPLGGGHFPLAPFYILLLTTILAGTVARILPRARLITGMELLVIWMQMVLASGIAYTGLSRTFFINLTVPFQFATAENNWQQILQPMLPPWLYPDEGAVDGLYNGLIGGREMSWFELIKNIPWHDWMRPLIAWGVFILLCYTVMIALINLLSRQWIHNERMNFPLLRVPQIMEEHYDNGTLSSFLLNPYLLWGLSIPIMLHLLGGLHYYFPSVPQLPTMVLAGPYFPKYGLLSGFHKLKIFIYPVFIGFAFLTARQISLSFWFFFLMGGLLYGLLSIMGYTIPAASLGITFGPTLARPEETQMIGAYGVFFLFLLWLSRHHLKNVVQQAIRPGPITVETEAGRSAADSRLFHDYPGCLPHYLPGRSWLFHPHSRTNRRLAHPVRTGPVQPDRPAHRSSQPEGTVCGPAGIPDAVSSPRPPGTSHHGKPATAPVRHRSDPGGCGYGLVYGYAGPVLSLRYQGTGTGVGHPYLDHGL